MSTKGTLGAEDHQKFPDLSHFPEICSDHQEGKNKLSGQKFDIFHDSSVITPTATPPDGGWGWVIVFASFIVNLISDGIGFGFGVIYVELLSYFNESKGKTAWVGSVFFSMPLICGPIASALVDKYGCKNMTILGSMLACIGFVSSSFANSLEILYFTFGVISGFGLALGYVAAIFIVAFYFESRRGLATGLSVSGTGIGTFVFPPLIRLLIDQYSWRGAVLILGAMFLNIAVCGMLMREPDYLDKRNFKDTVPELLSPQSPQLCSGLIKSKLSTPNSDRRSNSLFHLPTYTTCGKLPSGILKSWKELLHSTGERNYSANHQKAIICKDLMDNPLSFDLRNKTSHDLASAKPDNNCNLNLAGKTNSSEICRNSAFEPQSDLIPPDEHVVNVKFCRRCLTYRGAMLNLHSYHLKASSCPDIYHSGNSTYSSDAENVKFLKNIKKNLLGNFDPSIFRSVPYIVFCCSNFLFYMWYDIPYVYMPDNALHFGESEASYIISIIGILNTLGMVIFGYIADKWWMNVELLYSIVILHTGLTIFILPFLSAYWSQCVCAGLFGFFISANYSLAPVIIVHIISLRQFANAYGLLLLCQGIANLIGPPIGGFLFDMTGNYKLSFFSAGIGIMVSGFMVFFISGLCCRKDAAKTVSINNQHDCVDKADHENHLITKC